MSEPSGKRRSSRQAMLSLANSVVNRVRPAEHRRQLPEAAHRTDFTSLPSYRELNRHRAVADLLGIDSPFFKLHEGRSGATCQIDGKTYANFASYDYVGLNGEAELNDAAKAAIDLYGTSVSASRPTAGDRPLHRELERALAAHYETEEALCFVSGHGTNVSVVGELLGSGDLIVFDALCHNSIVLGTKLSGATRQSFPHNDMAALDALLSANRHNFDRVLIVAEGLYSMDGDVANLPELIAIKKRHDAWLMIDEAHSLGVLGKAGRGIFEHFNVSPTDVDIWMGTLSKALSGCGGYIAGSGPLIDILRFHASAFMFSVGMSPPVAAAVLTALHKLRDEPERVAALHRNGVLFVEECRRLGLDTGLTAGFAVGVVLIGDSLRTAKLAERLFERQINTIPVTYPAVPMRSARLRFFLTSEHTPEQIKQALQATREEIDRLDQEGFGLKAAALAARILAPRPE